MPEGCQIERWGQGKWLPSSLHASVILPKECPPLAEGDRLLVISQDCDVVHGYQNPAKQNDPEHIGRAFQEEPYVEVMVARTVSTKDPMRVRGRNPRRLQIELQTPAGQPLLLELNQRDKGLLPRQLLNSADPDQATLPLAHGNPTLVTIRDWLGKRYARAAFPNALDARLHRAYAKLKNKLEGDLADAVTRIFLRPHSFEELPAGERYTLAVRILVKERSPKALKAAALINSALLTCSDITLIEEPSNHIVREDEFTYADFASMLPWDFDYLSAYD